MKKIITRCLFIAILLAPTISSAFSGSEVNINKEGITTVSGAKVMQLAGPTLFMRLYWGDAFIRFTIKTTSNTRFYRATGEATTLKEVKEGDLLDVTGELESGSNTLTLVAKTVRNSSVQKAQSTFSGKIVGVDLQNSRFTLDSKTNGVVTVNVATTTVFTKGNRRVGIGHLKVGDTVTKVSGDYDLSTKIISANDVLVYIDLNTFKPRNFQGKLVEISGTSLPTSVKVLIDNKTYTVNLSAGASVMRSNRASVGLNRFEVDDVVRLYGSIQEVDEPVINATIIRNISI